MASRAATHLAGAALVLATAAIAGCGGDDGGSAKTAASAPRMTAAPATTPAPDTTTSPEDQPGGAGDEAGAVVPATLTIATGGRVTPTRVSVPAFFTIRLTGVSRDSAAHTIAFQGTTLRVPAGGRASVRVEGLKRGEYPVTIDGKAGAATIASGVEAGP